MRLHGFILLVLVLVFDKPIFASEVQYKDLSYDWHYLEDDLGILVPVTDSDIEQARSLTQIVDLERHADKTLRFMSSKDLCVFMNNQLYMKNDTNSVQYIPLKIAKAQNQSHVQITFYHPKKKLPYDDISLVINGVLPEGPLQKDLILGSKGLVRDPGPYRSLLIVSLVIMLLVVAYLRVNKPVILEAYYDAKRLIGKTMPDNYVLFNALNIHAVLVQLACSISLAVILLSNQYWLYPISKPMPTQTEIAINIAFFTILFQATFFLKYYLQLMICNLLGAASYVRIHYYEFMRLVALSSLVLVIVNIVSWFHHWPGRPVLYYTLVLLSVIWVIRLTWISLKHLNFRKVYFFSYICSSEIIPIILVLGQLVTL